MHGIEGTGERDSQRALAAKLPSIVLEITRGRARHLRREVRSSTFLIGTAPDCDLVLGDARFPEFHSYLYVTPERVIIRQLAAVPEIRVGGRITTCAALTDRDTLAIGSYEFRVLIQLPQGALRADRSGEPTVENHLSQFRQDWALERLLADVEQHRPSQPAPRSPLSLYVGDDEPQTDEPANQPARANQPIWRPSQRKAIS